MEIIKSKNYDKLYKKSWEDSNMDLYKKKRDPSLTISLDKKLPCRMEFRYGKQYQPTVRDLLEREEIQGATLTDVADFLNNGIPDTYFYNSFTDLVYDFASYLKRNRNA